MAKEDKAILLVKCVFVEIIQHIGQRRTMANDWSLESIVRIVEK